MPLDAQSTTSVCGGPNAADAILFLLTFAMFGVVGLGIFVGSRRSGDDVFVARRAALGALALLATWLGFAAFLATGGALSDWAAVPPRWPLLPLGAFIAIALVSRSHAASRSLHDVPATWVIGTQTFRIVVELGLYASYAAGCAPAQITFEGRNLDILVGLTAPVVAFLLATRHIGPKLAIAWNVAGLAILANTVGTVATSTPGPLHRDWGGAPLTAIATWPTVWLPAFLMPLAVFLHVSSLRQNVRALGSLRR